MRYLYGSSDLVLEYQRTEEKELKNLKTFVDASFGLAHEGFRSVQGIFAMPWGKCQPGHLQDNLSLHRVRQKLSSLHTTNPCKQRRRSSRYWRYSREKLLEDLWEIRSRPWVTWLWGHAIWGSDRRSCERCYNTPRSGGSSMYQDQPLLRMAWPNHYKVNNSWDIGKCWIYDLEMSLEKRRRLPAWRLGKRARRNDWKTLAHGLCGGGLALLLRGDTKAGCLLMVAAAG